MVANLTNNQWHLKNFLNYVLMPINKIVKNDRIVS